MSRLSNLAITGVIAFVSACSGQSENAAVETSPVTLQSAVSNDESVTASHTGIPLCLSSDTDADGDGWGWENVQSCEIPQTPINTDAQVGIDSSELPIGIVYYVWHCVTKTDVSRHQYSALNLAAGEELNISQILDGKQSGWGGAGSFHWWDQPAKGYYCLGNEPDLIRSHLEMLRDAGIDFLAIDITNHPNVASFDAETLILKSLRPLLEIAQTVSDSPRIVPWVPLASDSDGTRQELNVVCGDNPTGERCRSLSDAPARSMYQHVTNMMQNEFPSLTFQYKGKPLLLEAASDSRYPREITDVIRPQLETTWTVRRTWGLSKTTEDWQFLSPCSNGTEYFNSNGWSPNGCNQPINAGEQISVSAAYQYSYISEPLVRHSESLYTGGMPKFQGRTLAQQFRTAFDHRDEQPLVLLTGWNEWIAQRVDLQGRVAFVDSYDDSLNRDIEPGGESGDLYYYLMRDLITQYRGNQPFSFEDYFLTENSVLDANFYWHSYEDLQVAFEQDDLIGLTNHWLTIGLKEGRKPSVLFDYAYYGSRNPDLVDAGVTTPEMLLRHFLDFGFQEGRQGSSEFHAPTYVNQHPEVAALFGNNGYYKAFKHFVR